ncbi:MAG: hypothetical protein ACREAY_06215 [Nitrososphaera sp.]|uniref:hypothetical protein n=1 Tax=Nitrososphaera sp. TaxID=1971748 RepID=UPI003D701BB6
MALYPALYEKFAALQEDPLAGARLVYPAGAPSMALAGDIADCVVRVPAVRAENGSLLYGPFVLPDDDFGRYASSRLILASTCLLGAKVTIAWHHREALRKWIGGKQDPLRAGYVATVIFDELARQRIRKIMGEKFYRDVVVPADMLSAALLPANPDSLPAFFQAMLARSVLGVPSIHVSSLIREKIGDFVASLKGVKRAGDWEPLGDRLYGIVEKFPGRWHSVYLPYSERLPASREHIEIFRAGAIDQAAFERSMRGLYNSANLQDIIGEEIYFEISRERQRNAKILSRLERASKSLNIGYFGFPASDYAGYYRLHGELVPQIRRMIEQARIVRNVLDESTFEESGNVDLQVAIQAVASETVRTDMFVRDENLLKNESWAILVDSSLSLGGIAKQLRSIALCVAETAKDIIGQNPWGMFAFSDDLLCIKDFSEPYDSLAKSRIGGLVPDGLSHIPDALRLARNLVLEYAKDRNYVILVSDGLPSGYDGIEREMAGAVKELYSHGVTLAAIGVGSARIKKSIANARLVSEPAEMARAFSELYFALSS